MEKTREKVTQVLNQARDSLRILETLEREALAKARSFIRIPSAAERKRMTNDRILSSLKKLGVATRDEVEALEEKIQSLEEELATKQEQRSHARSSNAQSSSDSH